MADRGRRGRGRGRWKEEYDDRRGKYDDRSRSDFEREDDEPNGLATNREENSRHDIARRFNNLTDFLE